MNMVSKFDPGRGTWRLIAILCGAIILGIIRNWPGDVPDHVAGRAHVIDGDSLNVAGHEIRLVGIDAPEWRQICVRRGSDWSCGQAASRALKRRIAGARVVCDIENVDRYERLLAVCSIGDLELNVWMVRNGWAVAYGRYGPDERRAKQARAGIWASEFDRPDVWRNGNMTGAVAASAS